MLEKCHTAILLAGGKSKRMGFNKINIPFKGMRLLDYQIKQLKGVFDQIILVSNDLDDYDDHQVHVVSDEYKDIGPLAGLHVGLKFAETEYSYVIACDMPFIDTEFINNIRNQMINMNKDENLKELYVSRVDGHIEPFNAFYHKSVYKKIESFIDKENSYGLRYFIKTLNYELTSEEIVESYDSKMFVNLNTKDDLIKYEETEVVTCGKIIGRD